MAEDGITPQGPDEQASQVIYGQVVQSRAAAAYELRLQGKTASQIADELGYADESEVHNAISQRLERDAQYLTNAEKMSILQMELDRLDRLQSVLWPSAMTGDPKSVEAVLKVMDRRFKAVGIDRLDTASQQATVLVIGGAEADYVAKLKELADG